MQTIGIVFASWFLAEFYGYWLHILLHSDRFRWFSRKHMHHHLKCYGPTMKCRTPEYIQDTGDDILVGGLGLEWFIPALFLVIATGACEWAIGLSWFEILLSEAILITYSVFLFWNLHDAMHIKDTWILRVPFLRKRFLKARRLHDIHHNCISDDGLMQKNFGIAFPFFDHIFGTYQSRLGGINKDGVEAAYERYGISRDD